MAFVSKRFDDLGSDGSAARLGIMGGTFDPIHIAHLVVAEEVREKLDLDCVLFVPAGNPVFKRDQSVTDAAHRIEMCRLAVEGNPHFDVSTIEVDRGGDTYTVDTMHQLRAHYPGNVEFYFIVGSDAAVSMGKWRRSAELAEMTKLAVAIGRPGFAGEQEVRDALSSTTSFDFEVVHVSELEVSSSAVREKLVAGDPCRYLVPDVVRAYAKSHGLYLSAPTKPEGPANVAEDDPFSKEFFKARKKELKGRVSAKRFEHSLGVSKMCERLARCYGIDPEKAKLAGLLHDWDKGMDDDQARQRVHDLGMDDELDPWVVENMPRVLHGHTAARALGREFPQIPDDVLQAIDRHTVAALDMSPLDMALYIADATEPGRVFGKIDELRASIGEVSLEELYFRTYEYWTFLLIERRKTLHPDTMRIWNANVLRRQQAKDAQAQR